MTMPKPQSETQAEADEMEKLAVKLYPFFPEGECYTPAIQIEERKQAAETLRRLKASGEWPTWEDVANARAEGYSEGGFDAKQQLEIADACHREVCNENTELKQQLKTLRDELDLHRIQSTKAFAGQNEENEKARATIKRLIEAAWAVLNTQDEGIPALCDNALDNLQAALEDEEGL